MDGEGRDMPPPGRPPPLNPPPPRPPPLKPPPPRPPPPPPRPPRPYVRLAGPNVIKPMSKMLVTCFNWCFMAISVRLSVL